MTADEGYTVDSVSVTSGTCNAALDGNEITVSAVESNCTVTPAYEETSSEWTASITVVVNEDARNSRDEFTVTVDNGCSPASQDFDQSGNAITFDCTKLSVAAEEVFNITVDGLDNRSGICTGNDTFDQDGWSQQVTLTPSGNNFRADLVLEDNEGQCSSGEAVQTETTATYTVTADAGANGQLNTSATVTLQSGGGTSFGITPDPGYTVSGASVVSNPGNCSVSHDGSSLTVADVTGPCTVQPSYALEWTAAVVITVDEDASSNKDEFTVTVDNGCSPASQSFNESGDSITFACTKQSSDSSEAFDITVNGLDSNSGICQGNNSWDQSGWTASVVLTPSASAYTASLVLEDKQTDCDSNEAPDTQTSQTSTLATDNFDSGDEDWGSDAVVTNQEVRVGVNDDGSKKAEKEYEFGNSYRNQRVLVTLDVSLEPGWETSGGSADYIRINAEGQTVYDWESNPPTSISFVVELDNSGKLKLELWSDTTANSEYAAFDNIVITLL